MLKGAAKERLALAITMGFLKPAAAKRISCINAKPWDEVAVNTLTPVPEAPTAALMALCSDSTIMYSESRSPSATNLARYSDMEVWGVIG